METKPGQLKFPILSRIAICDSVITEFVSNETCICWLRSALAIDSGLLLARRGSQRRSSAARADGERLSIVWRCSPASSRTARIFGSEQRLSTSFQPEIIDLVQDPSRPWTISYFVRRLLKDSFFLLLVSIGMSDWRRGNPHAPGGITRC